MYQLWLGRLLTFEFAQVECLSCSVTNLLYSGLKRVHSNWSDKKETNTTTHRNIPRIWLAALRENCIPVYLHTQPSSHPSETWDWPGWVGYRVNVCLKTTKLINCLIHFHQKVCFESVVITLLLRTKESPLRPPCQTYMFKGPTKVDPTCSVENTSSRLITEVKQHWAKLVPGWETAWEYLVL